MLSLGIVDPVPVKSHALKAALEIASAILRIDTIIKKQDEGQAPSEAKGVSEDMGF
jgi:chaperonin GroEL (HSP60 family)